MWQRKYGSKQSNVQQSPVFPVATGQEVNCSNLYLKVFTGSVINPLIQWSNWLKPCIDFSLSFLHKSWRWHLKRWWDVVEDQSSFPSPFKSITLSSIFFGTFSSFLSPTKPSSRQHNLLPAWKQRWGVLLQRCACVWIRAAAGGRAAASLPGCQRWDSPPCVLSVGRMRSRDAVWSPVSLCIGSTSCLCVLQAESLLPPSEFRGWLLYVGRCSLLLRAAHLYIFF